LFGEVLLGVNTGDGLVCLSLPGPGPMPNALTRIILFCSSYAPLFLILAIRSWIDNRWLAVSLAAVATVSVLVLWLFVRKARTLAAQKVAITSVISRDGDAMSYIVTYLLPFLAVDFTKPSDVVSLGIVFGVIGLLYVNSNLIHTNPLLNLVRYHIFEVQDSDGKTTALITRRSYIRNGAELDIVSLGDYVSMEKH
jgi:hypothetical protein